MTITRLDKLLKSEPGGRLEKLVQRAKLLDNLTALLRSRLEPDAAAALLAANLRDGELVLICSSPGWASRLRFESAALLGAAREHGLEATGCQVRVARSFDTDQA